jgi:hypothetical protein
MNRSMILLVEPIKWDKNGEDWIGVTEDEAEMKRRYEEFMALQGILTELGFSKFSDGRSESYSFNCEGLNWEAQMSGHAFEISHQNIELLKGRVARLAEIRKKALEKLTTEEQYALGLLKQD